MQSPKSRRAKAPGENPSSDNNPTARSGGQTGKQGSSLAQSKGHVPKPSAVGHSGAGKGNTPRSDTVPTHAPAPSQAGRPGYQKCNPCGTQRGRK